MAYQATRLLMNSLKWLPPSPTPGHDHPYVPLLKPSSDALSRILHPTGHQLPCWNKTSREGGRQSHLKPRGRPYPIAAQFVRPFLDSAVFSRCLLCKEEPHTVEHWLQTYPNLDAHRQRTFSSPSTPFLARDLNLTVMSDLRSGV